MLFPFSPGKPALRTLALATALGLGACGGAHPSAMTGPSRGVGAWRTVESPHFTLETDVGQAEAKEIAGALEKIYTILYDVAFPMEKEPNLHTHVIVFGEQSDYAMFGPKASTGAFSPQGFGTLDEPALMTYGGISDAVRKILVHELTHRFVHYLCPQVPVWLDEGLADYYETIAVEKGRATLGKTDYVLGFGKEWKRYSGGIPVEALPAFGELEQMDPKAFYPAREAPETNEGTPARHQQIANYASAWATVHVLQNGSNERREGLHRWLSGMAAGGAARATFQQAFGDGAIAAIEKERLALVEKVARGHIHLLYQEVHEGAPAHVEERALRPAEVNLLWAKLQLGNGKSGEAGARHFVEEALKAEPGLTAARLFDAALLERARRFEEAGRAITEAASAAPGDEHAARALFTVRAKPWLYGGDTPGSLAKADEILTAWLARAREAPTLTAFAGYLATHGRSDEAVSVATRAATLDPTCARCFSTLAVALFRTGQFAAALDVQERAVAILGEHRGWREMVDRLDLYRKATSAITAWKARPAPGPEAGVLPMDVATAVEHAQTFHFRECYERGLSRNPKLTGSVVLRATVGPEGKVTNVERVRPEDVGPNHAPLAPPLGDEDVIACLTEQTRLFRFPESARGIRFVSPVRLMPGR